MKIIEVVGARPNFVKVAPLHAEMKKKGFDALLVHTGQHYDKSMSDVFFQDLEIPFPDVYLGVGSGSHAEQTGRVMMEFEKILLKEKPDLTVVVGDVNSTLACAISSAKLNVPVAHVEAGLRSRDWTMPEEVNRVLTDRISKYLFTPSKDADENLAKEGITSGVFFVGNIMIDSLKQHLGKAKKRNPLPLENEYCLITMHRPENVDNPKNLAELVDVINAASKETKAIFPVHPRTRKNFEATALDKKLDNALLTNPLGYLDFINLQMSAKFVLTDSGGVQEETTFLGIPCLTVRRNTERPITITQGTNTLVGLSVENVEKTVSQILSNKYKEGAIPEKWDGLTSKRICDVLKKN